ncbi:DUF305 domain-containing protein [Nesterenkonia xinjiangensis]|uniref:Uncharacterized protein (DUF305 family) n=1 Tax=Nesterenkonia xinjiangensis TaxID=225327 RepID=A0A7Z0GKW9_9MICC|nr:DUF305 domain-containing protein [Nesterenkonia xinjiangensis]NYJ77832.1 uncharacterized protein (DUF305 family) [Nesterenkonia xinjiangensis]
MSLIAAALAGLMAVSACSPEAQDSEDSPTPSSAVLMPENPGDEAERVEPEDYDGAQGVTDEWNDLDAEYMTMMIAHHAQAMEMTGLVPDRADSEQLKTFAERMHLAQKGEIGYMADWLEERELPVPQEARDVAEGRTPSQEDHGHGHDHATMPGMLSTEEMTALRQTEGEEFDMLFLEGMIAHHEGALEMSEGVQAEGYDLATQELAEHVHSDQTAEISRLKQLLDEL